MSESGQHANPACRDGVIQKVVVLLRRRTTLAEVIRNAARPHPAPAPTQPLAGNSPAAAPPLAPPRPHMATRIPSPPARDAIPVPGYRRAGSRWTAGVGGFGGIAALSDLCKTSGSIERRPNRPSRRKNVFSRLLAPCTRNPHVMTMS